MSIMCLKKVMAPLPPTCVYMGVGDHITKYLVGDEFPLPGYKHQKCSLPESKKRNR